MEVATFNKLAKPGAYLRIGTKESAHRDYKSSAAFVADHGYIYMMLRKSDVSVYSWDCRSLASGKECELWPMDVAEITDAPR